METIFYWPDGCWCHACEFNKMSHKSDDFGLLEVSVDVSDDEINRLVDRMLS